MGILNFFKKPKSGSKFAFPSEEALRKDDLGVPPLPPNPKIPNPDLREFDGLLDSPKADNNQANFKDQDDFDIPDFTVDSGDDKGDGLDLPDQISEEFDDGLVPDEQQNYLQSKQKNFKTVNFVEISNFRLALDSITDAKQILSQVDLTYRKLKKEGHDEDKLFDSWHTQANDILNKLTYIDNTLFEKG